ncbi:MAG: DUF6390 family protein [archaeon]
MDNISFLCRYSFITNKLRYCGPEDAYKKFLQYIKEPTKELAEEIKSHIKRFEGLYPYLKAIAEKNNLDEFDYRVAEAYWLGNELLDKFTAEDNRKIIMSLAERGLPRSFAEKLCVDIPNMFPHHSFNVVYVGVGKITGSVPTNLENINNCLIRPAEVISVHDDYVIARHRPYKELKGNLYLDEPQDGKFEYIPEFGNVKEGNIVSLHWNYVVDTLDAKALGNLLVYTEKNLFADRFTKN